MTLDENITQTWENLQRQTQNDWKTKIRELIEPELERRGITITSASSMSVGGLGEFLQLLICETSNGAYMEIHASSKKGFSISVEMDKEPFTWPTSPMSVYDRKNYTIRQLLDWLDKKAWNQ